MAPSHSRCSPQDAKRAPRSAFAPIPPPQRTVPSHDAQPLRAQHAHTTSNPATTVQPTDDTVEVRINYGGPLSLWCYGRPNAPAVHPIVENHIDFAHTAHQRRLNAHGQDPLLAPPSDEGTHIDLRYLDFGLNMSDFPTRASFKAMLDAFAPPEIGERWPEWEIVCRRCGAAVKHFHTDARWNGVYLAHLGSRYCQEREARRGAW
ncbi:hypothetical protein HYPSUDRAFT_59463 [Hypholoma sublateritium FD-334 SS-4]|uniref:Uncharacterized protein n=1 Tax=Hypholoma sublateritium (strain FD-334 SS-4) TaxID=945553 RepID=A0A0D2P0X8_HYPSF|nr:hypothetical protein HYPSUDRAFT_59463 [Hypholoma sublateritium FD-334 SS-4]